MNNTGLIGVKALPIYSESVLLVLISSYLHLDFPPVYWRNLQGFYQCDVKVRQHLRTADRSSYLTGIAIMTDTHCIAISFDQEVHVADNRRLKVGYASRYSDYSRLPVKCVQFPFIVVKGQWLKVAGFDTGTRVDVRVMQDRIVLTV